MKLVKNVIVLCLLGITSCQAQTDKHTTATKKENKQIVTKEMNLLDEQTKMFGQLFDLAGMGQENPFRDAKNYLEYIDNSEMSEEQKKQLREMYKVYDLSLDPMKKDSLKIMVEKMLKNALDKTQNDSQE